MSLVLAMAVFQEPVLAANDYASQCASSGCHGPLATSDRYGAFASEIKAAIASVPAMRSLSHLTDAELNAIALELEGLDDLGQPASAPSPSGSPEPEPTESPIPSPSPSPSPVPQPCTNDRPIVNAIPDQDASVGQELTFTVSALDCNDVPIVIKASRLKGGSLPAGGQDFDDTGLWVGQYAFTPVPSQANKSFAVRFTAVQTGDGHKASKPAEVRIRVFPQGSSYEDGAITGIKVHSARWSGGRLLVKGKIQFSKALNGSERTSLAESAPLAVTNGDGTTEYGSAPIKPNGKWSIEVDGLTESTVPCVVAGQFNGETGTPRTVKKAPSSCVR